MRFANMKIGVRLGLGFGLILLLVAAMGATGIMRLENINDASRNLVDHSLQKQKAAEDWLLATSVNGVRTLALVKSSDPETQQFFQKAITAQSKQITDIQNGVEASLVNPEEKQLFAEVGKKRAVYVDLRKAIFAVKDKGNEAEAKQLIDSKMIPALDAYVDSVRNVLAYYQNEVKLADQSITADYGSGRMTLIIGAVIALILGALIAWRLTVGITRPLQEALSMAESVLSLIHI